MKIGAYICTKCGQGTPSGQPCIHCSNIPGQVHTNCHLCNNLHLVYKTNRDGVTFVAPCKCQNQITQQRET